MNRVYLGVYILAVLLFWEAVHNYGQEMRKQAEAVRKRLVASTQELIEVSLIMFKTFAEIGATMEQAARQLEAYRYVMAGASWHVGSPLDEARQRLETPDEFSIQDQFEPEPVYLDLCWRCEDELTEAEMDFGLCEECRQELEDL